MCNKYICLVASFLWIVLSQCTRKEEAHLHEVTTDAAEEVKDLVVHQLNPIMQIDDLLKELNPSLKEKGKKNDLFGSGPIQIFERLDEARSSDLCWSLMQYDPKIKLYTMNFQSLNTVINRPDLILKEDEFVAYKEDAIYCYLGAANQERFKEIMAVYADWLTFKTYIVEVSLIESDRELTIETLDRTETREIFRGYNTIDDPKYERGPIQSQIDFDYLLDSGELVHVEATVRQVDKDLLLPVESESDLYLYAHCTLHTSRENRGFNHEDSYFHAPYVEAESEIVLAELPPPFLSTFKWSYVSSFISDIYELDSTPMPITFKIPDFIQKIHQLPQSAVGFPLNEVFKKIGVHIPEGGHVYFCATTDELICYGSSFTKDQLYRNLIFSSREKPLSFLHQIEFIEVPLPRSSTSLGQIDYSKYKALGGFDLLGRPGDETIFSNSNSLISETVTAATVGHVTKIDVLFHRLAFRYKGLTYSSNMDFTYLFDKTYFMPLIKYPGKETLIALKIRSIRKN